MKPFRENQKKRESHPVLDGNALYEIDDACIRKKRRNVRYPARPAQKK